MNAFLFSWNPVKWPWPELAQDIEDMEHTGVYTDDWSCAAHKSVKLGDRAFLVKVGKKPTGIMGAGYISSLPFMGKNHKGNETMRVLINFEMLLNPATDELLSLDVLRDGRMASQLWTPQASGISIRPGVIDELEVIWGDLLARRM